ncbi:MAG: PEGA domain-containing protein [Waddliaceae bacterium]|jgi:hypothetical protein|nr:PEGA domain-containing protein [Waddliaceae bacterium]MBT3579492.1 PEGA domain-containing protein [Waddliaceae bacterium]MBT4444651.1 PEGA domain-containing protein [Waddliaceae bacterium]MBT6929216.1 PEGA domain-containing protein [Waddliaceae bacterium]
MKKFIKKLSAVCAVLAVVVMTTSFASIIKGTDQTITFESNIDGAEVYIDGLLFGKTPFAVNLKKNKYSSIMVKKDGYATQTLPLNKNFDPVTLLDFFWDYSTTDLITGAAFEYEPNKLFFNLEKESKK